MKNIFKPILGCSPKSCSQHWIDPLSNVWITFFFFLALTDCCCWKNIHIHRKSNWSSINAATFRSPTLTTKPKCYMYWGNRIIYIGSGTNISEIKKIAAHNLGTVGMGVNGGHCACIVHVVNGSITSLYIQTNGFGWVGWDRTPVG